MIQLRPVLAVSAILVHFSTLSLGMLDRSFKTPWLFQIQLAYARLTGAGSSYSFFSPNVPHELQFQFEVENSDGSLETVNFEEMNVPEIRARMGNMIRFLGKTYSKENVARSVAASFVAQMYQRYPDAKSITLNAFIYDLPSMMDYRLGKQAGVVKVYSARFGRGDS